MKIELWRVFQHDCPVVSVSGFLSGSPLMAISYNQTGPGIHGFLGVRREDVRRVVGRLREDPRVAQARVAKLQGGKGVVELFMRNTHMMGFLASKQLVVWFQPLYALDSYEYWMLATLGVHWRSGTGCLGSYACTTMRPHSQPL